MYGLPENFDTGFVAGKKLEQICFSENQVCFHFDSALRITAISAFTHQGAEAGSQEQLSDFPVSNSNVMQLLGSCIADGIGSPDGTLTLTFDNGHKLRFLDTSREYESYTIDFDGRTVVV